MKKYLSVILVLALVLAFGAGMAFAEDAPAGLQKDLVVLYTSDVHCGVDTGWGYAGLYEIKNSLSEDYYVLLVDDGDAVQGEPIGTMTTGESIIDLMNATGYDIAIPGNHEFDYGMDRFFELVEKADYPYISCNFNKEGELVFDPYVIREFDGVKIAFVGATTPDTLRSSTPKYFMNDEGEFIYGFFQDKDGSGLYNAVQKAVDDARAEGADYVILMAHLGNETEVSPWMYSEVIENTTGIDALLDGHSHDTDQVVMKNKNDEDVVRSACGTKFEAVGALWIKTDGSVSSELFSWDSSVSASELLGIQNPVVDAVAEETGDLNEALSTVVARSAVDLIINDPEAKTAEGKPVRIIRNTETNLGDLCADAYLDQSGDADIAFVNGGGIRASINQGDITLNDILKVNPFGNSLTVIEVTGQQVLDALEWSVHALPGEFGGFNHVAGLTYEVDTTIPSPCQTDDTMFAGVDDTMARRVQNVVIGGEPLDPQKTYKLASHNYQLLDYGDGYTMYEGSPVLQESVKLDNQVLIDYITGTLGGVVGEGYTEPYGQGRMVSITDTAAAPEETAADEIEEVQVVLPEDNGLAGIYKWIEMGDYGVETYLILWDNGIGSIDIVGTGTVRGVFYNDETMQVADEGTVPQTYSYADDQLIWTYTDEQGEHASTFVRLTAEERAAYEALGVGSVVGTEAGENKGNASPWPDDNGGLAGVYKWVEMENVGVTANLILFSDGTGVFDMLGVVESVKYDDTTMQTSGEGALPQSYTYADGTLTWTTAGEEGAAASTFVKLTAEELAAYEARGIGNAE